MSTASAMSSERSEASTRRYAPGSLLVRRVSPALFAATFSMTGGCSILFDAPSVEGVSAAQSKEVLKEVARREAEAAAEHARERASERITSVRQDGADYPQRMFLFEPSGARPDLNIRNGPMMVVSWRGGAGAELVLESPMPGLVYLDENAIGLVQDGSVRAMSLQPGAHRVRIEQLARPPMVVDFFVDEGERVTLRWQSR